MFRNAADIQLTGVYEFLYEIYLNAQTPHIEHLYPHHEDWVLGVSLPGGACSGTFSGGRVSAELLVDSSVV